MIKKMRIKAVATFMFETSDSWEDAVESINRQIASDLNEYWQNGDDTQMTEIKLTCKEVR